MCATKPTIEEVKSEWELSASYVDRGEVDKFKGLNPGRSQAGVKKQWMDWWMDLKKQEDNRAAQLFLAVETVEAALLKNCKGLNV